MRFYFKCIMTFFCPHLTGSKGYSFSGTVILWMLSVINRIDFAFQKIGLYISKIHLLATKLMRFFLSVPRLEPKTHPFY